MEECPHWIDLFLLLLVRPPPTSTLFPYTTLFRSKGHAVERVTFQTHYACWNYQSHPSACRGQCAHETPCSRSIRSPRNLIRSEVHTSELQSKSKFVRDLALENSGIEIHISDQGVP